MAGQIKPKVKHDPWNDVWIVYIAVRTDNGYTRVHILREGFTSKQDAIYWAASIDAAEAAQREVEND